MKKGRFANLDARMPAAPAAQPEPQSRVIANATRRSPSREGKVGIMVWVKEDTRHQLNSLATREPPSRRSFSKRSTGSRARGLHPFAERKRR
jgi:hypothetical protein